MHGLLENARRIARFNKLPETSQHYPACLMSFFSNLNLLDLAMFKNQTP